MKKIKVFDSPEKAKEKVPLNRLQKLRTKKLSICLVHSPDGFYATNDACPHMGASLSEGRINYLNELICPLHSYRYKLQNGQECQNRTPDLETYQTELNQNGLFIYLPE